jgi:hypothetical protein
MGVGHIKSVKNTNSTFISIEVVHTHTITQKYLNLIE